jgi:hypothetical protein
MNQNELKHTEIAKLYALIEKVKVASLGADYQTRIQFNQIKEKAAQRIDELKKSMSANDPTV